MRASFLLLSLLLSGCLQAETAFENAEELFSTFGQQIAKRPSPSLLPQTQECLGAASVWLSLDCDRLEGTGGVENPLFWSLCKEIGFEGIFFRNLKSPDGIGILAPWKNSWSCIREEALKKSLLLIGEGVGASLSWGPDFALALQNAAPYPSLFRLIEIPSCDWPLLPEVPVGMQSVNVPWLSLQALYKKGYVPEEFAPYTKESAWNTTPPCLGKDGTLRRWIYLKEGEDSPLFSWLEPTFSAERLGAGFALEGLFIQGQKILTLDGRLPPFAKKTMALWIRKMGGFSIETTEKGWRACSELSADALFDTATPAPLLHALLTQDAEALRLLYLLLLQKEIPINRFVHQLAPFDRFVSDWSQWLSEPKRQVFYWQEQVTTDALKASLLREDLSQLGKREDAPFPYASWPSYCGASLQSEEEKEIQKSHLLLAFFYAMQPGIFSLSAEDLLGMQEIKEEGLKLLDANPNSLYASLPMQMRSLHSFASGLRALLEIRRTSQIKEAKLLQVPSVHNKSTCLLLFQGKKGLFLSAVNFGSAAVCEKVELPLLKGAFPIELQSGLQEKKELFSPVFSFSIPPRSGKLFFFQRKGE